MSEQTPHRKDGRAHYSAQARDQLEGVVGAEPIGGAALGPIFKADGGEAILGVGDKAVAIEGIFGFQKVVDDHCLAVLVAWDPVSVDHPAVMELVCSLVSVDCLRLRRTYEEARRVPLLHYEHRPSVLTPVVRVEVLPDDFVLQAQLLDLL